MIQHLTLSIFGSPVSHSKSPLMHNMALKNLNLQGCYGRYLLEDGKKIKEKFLALGLDGANITVPHKEYAFECADEVRGIAKKIGAVNTYVLENGSVVGYNTDAEGFYISISDFKNITNALIIGAGGTAKSIAEILKEKNIKTTILNRSSDRLTSFREKGFECFGWEDFKPKEFDIIINTTSAGLKDEQLPCPATILDSLCESAKYAFDVVYGKETPFLNFVKNKNLIFKDGRDMLLNQGVLAFLLFTNKKFDFEMVKKEMQKALSL